MKNYYLFGDSLMKGVMPDENKMYHSSDSIHFELLESEFGFSLKNYSMPTFTSDRVLDWMKMNLKKDSHADVLMIECIGNDCDGDWSRYRNGGFKELKNRTSLEAFLENYQSMVDFASNYADKLVIVLPPPVAFDKYIKYLGDEDDQLRNALAFLTSGNELKDNFGRYKDALVEFAVAHNIEILDLGDMFQNLDFYDDYFSPDGIHPNERGYGLIHEGFARYFRGELRDA